MKHKHKHILLFFKYTASTYFISGRFPEMSIIKSLWNILSLSINSLHNPTWFFRSNLVLNNSYSYTERTYNLKESTTCLRLLRLYVLRKKEKYDKRSEVLQLRKVRGHKCYWKGNEQLAEVASNVRECLYFFKKMILQKFVFWLSSVY